jgi:hypothetical protein
MSLKTLYIFVLAGGLDNNNDVHDFVKIRLDKAIEIYNNKLNNLDCKIICLGGGTYHKPPNLNILKYVIHESSSCAIYLRNNGIPEIDIMREWSSYDTIANAFFAYTNFILPLEIKNMIIITSNFHLPRTKCIFDYFINLLNNVNYIEYIGVNDNMIPKKILEERINRENDSLNNFKKNIVDKQMKFDEFTRWFFTNHNAYKAIVSYYPLDNDLNKTY